MPLDEQSFATQIEDLAATFGFRHFHNLWSPGSDYGFPDYVLVNPEKQRILFVEIKGTRGMITAEQAYWLEDLMEAKQEVWVWWPEDFDNIAGILRRERR